MILFDGADLEEIEKVRIEDIRVNPITITPQTRQRVGFGQDFVRMTGGNRTITISFAVLEDDKDARFALLQSIVEWAKPYKESQLVLPMEPTKHFDCRCTGYPEPSYRMWWESKLRLVFTTFENPYWTANDEVTAQCGTTFSIGGTAPPLIKITRRLSSKVASQTYSANGQSMFFDTIPAGNLVVDLNKQTAEVSGTSIMKYFGKTSRFITPVTGNVRIAGTGTITYRERWV